MIDGQNIENEISFVKSFFITDETIVENKPNNEKLGKESLVDLEIDTKNKNEIVITKIIYK